MSICFLKKISGLALFLAISTTMGAYANTLSEVQINADTQGYNIVLKSESPAQMKKVVNSPDKMSIELKDVQPAEDLNTVYNNVSNIDNVTIQPIAKQDLKITLKGKGISSSKIYFEEIKTLPVVQSEEESIELNPPVNSYSPVYSGKMLVQEDQTSNPQVNEALTRMNISRDMLVTLKDFLNGQQAKFIGIFFVFAILVGAAFLMFRPKRESSSVQQIGLSSGHRNPLLQRELALAKGMSAPVAARVQTVDSYMSGAQANYGMNAYRQSQRNPYMTNNLTQHRTGVSGIARKPVVERRNLSMQPPSGIQSQNDYSRMLPVSEPVRPVMGTIPVQPAVRQEASVNVDSMKFLESITKIYEKNGREDLAKGLKDNLKKAKMVKMSV